jgi:hypothetical protein
MGMLGQVCCNYSSVSVKTNMCVYDLTFVDLLVLLCEQNKLVLVM